MDKIQDSLHLNYSVITENIEQGAKVLDLGCGSGELLKRLVDKTLYRLWYRYKPKQRY